MSNALTSTGLTPASFRQSYMSVFGDDVKYTNTDIAFQIAIGVMLLNRNVLGQPSLTADVPPTTMYDYLLGLFVAHNLVLDGQAAATAAAGGTPGLQTGVISNKSLGPGSIGYDVAAGIVPDAAHWNLTIYGVRFIRTARLIGSFGVQVGIGITPFGAGFGAWPGPYPYPAPSDTGF